MASVATLGTPWHARAAAVPHTPVRRKRTLVGPQGMSTSRAPDAVSPHARPKRSLSVHSARSARSTRSTRAARRIRQAAARSNKPLPPLPPATPAAVTAALPGLGGVRLYISTAPYGAGAGPGNPIVADWVPGASQPSLYLHLPSSGTALALGSDASRQPSPVATLSSIATPTSAATSVSVPSHSPVDTRVSPQLSPVPASAPPAAVPVSAPLPAPSSPPAARPTHTRTDTDQTITTRTFPAVSADAQPASPADDEPCARAEQSPERVPQPLQDRSEPITAPALGPTRLSQEETLNLLASEDHDLPSRFSAFSAWEDFEPDELPPPRSPRRSRPQQLDSSSILASYRDSGVLSRVSEESHTVVTLSSQPTTRLSGPRSDERIERLASEASNVGSDGPDTPTTAASTCAPTPARQSRSGDRGSWDTVQSVAAAPDPMLRMSVLSDDSFLPRLSWDWGRSSRPTTPESTVIEFSPRPQSATDGKFAGGAGDDTSKRTSGMSQLDRGVKQIMNVLPTSGDVPAPMVLELLTRQTSAMEELQEGFAATEADLRDQLRHQDMELQQAHDENARLERELAEARKREKAQVKTLEGMQAALKSMEQELEHIRSTGRELDKETLFDEDAERAERVYRWARSTEVERTTTPPTTMIGTSPTPSGGTAHDADLHDGASTVFETPVSSARLPLRSLPGALPSCNTTSPPLVTSPPTLSIRTGDRRSRTSAHEAEIGSIASDGTERTERTERSGSQRRSASQRRRPRSKRTYSLKSEARPERLSPEGTPPMPRAKGNATAHQSPLSRTVSQRLTCVTSGPVMEGKAGSPGSAGTDNLSTTGAGRGGGRGPASSSAGASAGSEPSCMAHRAQQPSVDTASVYSCASRASAQDDVDDPNASSSPSLGSAYLSIGPGSPRSEPRTSRPSGGLPPRLSAHLATSVSSLYTPRSSQSSYASTASPSTPRGRSDPPVPSARTRSHPAASNDIPWASFATRIAHGSVATSGDADDDSQARHVGPSGIMSSPTGFMNGLGLTFRTTAAPEAARAPRASHRPPPSADTRSAHYGEAHLENGQHQRTRDSAALSPASTLSSPVLTPGPRSSVRSFSSRRARVGSSSGSPLAARAPPPSGPLPLPPLPPK